MKTYRHPFLLVLVFTCICLSGCQDNGKPPRTPAIEWSADRKLTWDDFKRKPKEGTGLDAESGVYVTSSGIGCQNGKVVYQVTAVFEPDESWVDPAKKSAELLRHEQGHFDIAEIYARKLRKALAALANLCEDKKKFDEAVKKAQKDNADELAKAEQKYDDDTAHGDDPDKQKQAEDDIKKSLDDLKDFKK